MSLGARIAGIAMALPERLVSNEQIAAGLGVDADWIEKRTGTRERPWASADERLSELAADAGRAALERAGVDAGELDLVLVATSTADEITPNAAPLVAGLIGAEARRRARRRRRLHRVAVGSGDGVRPDRVRARPACAGGRRRLPVALPRHLRSRHRAAVRRWCGRRGRVGDRRADRPDRADRVALRSLGIAPDPVRPRRPHPHGGPGVVPSGGCLDVRRDDRGARLRAAAQPEDIGLFVYHQANSRIIRAVGQRLGLPAERVVDYVDRFANASTATLPIALSVAEAEGRLQRATWCCWPRSAAASPGARPSCSGAQRPPPQPARCSAERDARPCSRRCAWCAPSGPA